MKELINELNHLRKKSNRAKERKQAIKKSLRQCKEPFLKVFHASANPMIITTAKEGQIVDLNDAYARITGFSREDLIGKTTTEYGIWADPQQREKVIGQALEKKIIRNLEVRLPIKGGGILTVPFCIEAIILSGERYLFSIMIDITDRKRAEMALRESEEKYRILVENSLQGLAIVQDSRIVLCNRRLAKITGYSVEELLSLSSGEMTAIICEDDRSLIESRVLDRMAGKPTPSHYAFRGIKKDGTELWLEVYSSLIEYNGKPALQSAFMDITEHKKAAENLNKALDWQTAIFEGSRDAIMISDANSKFVDANEATCILTGYSKEELMNMRTRDLDRNANPSELDDYRNRILGGEDILRETKISTKNGNGVDVEFSQRRVFISGVPYIHSIARDITIRKRLETQFQQSQKMEAIGALAGGVAHDFNNLLSVINGYSELMLEDLSEEHPLRKDLEQIKMAGKRAASLTSQLLAFSRKQILQPEIVCLNEAVAEMSTMLRRVIGEDIELAVILRSDLGLVSADPGQLQQIIMNLAINARDAMPQGGKLTIETGNVDFDEDYVSRHPMVKKGTYVMLAVSDNGMGMDAATQARIFEPFFTTKGKGTGLGLSTIYGIVKQSDGFIWVYSELGKGTTFKVYFPRVEGKQTLKSSQNKSDSAFRGSETILVVEDEIEVRALTCRILRERGYKVIGAADGKDALRLVRAHKEEIHLVITDVIMPGMSGKELVAQLKAVRPQIEALYVSGYTGNVIIHHGILDSGIAFLQKPFTVEGLALKVREVIDSR